jgi:acyl-CoA dehydrogenase
MQRDTSFLNWPFFDAHHRQLALQLELWCETHLPVDHSDIDQACIKLVQMLGDGGWLTHSAIDPEISSVQALDVRSLCLIRETLARHDALADFAFAMQGLGTGAISLFGTKDQQQWLYKTRAGEVLAGFALTEPQSGSDVANIELSATFDGDHYILNGEKTWISNGGIAHVYCVFARTGEAAGAKGLSAFLVATDSPGLKVAERLHTIAPHPLARLSFNNVTVNASQLLGQAGDGFNESLERSQNRRLFGAPLNDLQMVQGHLADMATQIDAAALLVYRAAWTKDQGVLRVSKEAAMAKLYATEMAQKVIDQAVQIHGAEGVRTGATVECLYREIRALRIYEGATDVQKIIIAKQLQAGARS